MELLFEKSTKQVVLAVFIKNNPTNEIGINNNLPAYEAWEVTNTVTKETLCYSDAEFQYYKHNECTIVYRFNKSKTVELVLNMKPEKVFELLKEYTDKGFVYNALFNDLNKSFQWTFNGMLASFRMMRYEKTEKTLITIAHMHPAVINGLINTVFNCNFDLIIKESKILF